MRWTCKTSLLVISQILNGSTKDWTPTPLDMFHEHTVHTVDHSGCGSTKQMLSNKQNKITDVKTESSPMHSTPSAKGALNINTKTIVYDPLTLKCIRDNIQHDLRYSTLPSRAVSMIRELRINNKTIRNKAYKRPEIHQTGVNRSNLLKIKCCSGKNPPNIVVATCNTQSLKSKELQVSELLDNHAIDALLITETWLTSKDSLWKQTTDLNKNQCQLHTHDRASGKGGGIALISKCYLQVTKVSSSHRRSFEQAMWKVSTKNTTLTIHGIYHPPYSLTNKITNTMFLDDFTEYITETIPDNNQTNNLFVGDFNLHVSEGNNTDIDSAIFLDTWEAMSLYQHVGFSTHNQGNTLDLVISELGSNMRVKTTTPGPFISDHHAVISILTTKRETLKQQTRMVHKLKKVTQDQWNKCFNQQNVKLNANLDEMVQSLKDEFRRVMDEPGSRIKMYCIA